jgi:hypothetical protein
VWRERLLSSKQPKKNFSHARNTKRYLTNAKEGCARRIFFRAKLVGRCNAFARAARIVPRIIQPLAIRIRLRVIGRMKQHPMARVKVPGRAVVGFPRRNRVLFWPRILRARLIQRRHRNVVGTATAATGVRRRGWHRNRETIFNRQVAAGAGHQH